MPNHKSPEKRVRADVKRHLRNVAMKSTLKTLRAKVIKAATKEEAAKNLNQAISLYDKAASKGIIHKNTASRKISRMTKKINAIKTA